MSLKKRKVIKRKINKKNKGVSKFKIILVALLLSVIAGKAAFSDGDVESILTNWFKGKESQHISEMEKEMNVEREVLIKQFKEDIGNEFLATEVSLDNFTLQETEKSIEELKRYTGELKTRLRNENGGKETEITLYLDGVMNDAIAQMKMLEELHLRKEQTITTEIPVIEKEETQIQEQVAPVEETEVIEEKVETSPEVIPLQPESDIKEEPTPEPIPEPITETETIVEPTQEPITSTDEEKNQE
jgi:hypothetical protein